MNMIRGLVAVVFCAIPACTTVHGVGGGSAPGEFYFAAQKSFLAFAGAPYIVKCVEVRDPAGVELSCERVLAGREAGELSPGSSPSGRKTFVRSSR